MIDLYSYTAAAENALALAVHFACGEDYVGTTHLLYGLLQSFINGGVQDFALFMGITLLVMLVF